MPRDAGSGRPRRPDGPRRGRPATDRGRSAAPPGRGSGRPARSGTGDDRGRGGAGYAGESPGRRSDRPTGGAARRGGGSPPPRRPKPGTRSGQFSASRRDEGRDESTRRRRTDAPRPGERPTARPAARPASRSGPGGNTGVRSRGVSPRPETRRTGADRAGAARSRRPDAPRPGVGPRPRPGSPTRDRNGRPVQSETGTRYQGAERDDRDQRSARAPRSTTGTRPGAGPRANAGSRPAPRKQPRRSDSPPSSRPPGSDRTARPARPARPTGTERTARPARPARPGDRRPGPPPLPAAGRGWGSVARKGARLLGDDSGHGPDNEREVARAGGAHPRPQWTEEVWVFDGVAADGPERPSRRRRPSATTSRPDEALPTDVVDEIAGAIGRTRAGKVADRLAVAARAYQHDRYPEALRITRELVDRVPESAAARELHGLICYRLGRWREAVKHLEAAAPCRAATRARCPCSWTATAPRDTTDGWRPCGTSSAARRRRPTSWWRAASSWPRTWPSRASWTRPSSSSPLPGRRATCATPETAISGSGTCWPTCTRGPGTCRTRRELFARVVAVDPELADAAERLRALGVPRRRQRRGAADGRR